MNFTFRPLPAWPYPETADRRSRWAFKASFDATLRQLRQELGYLGARDVIIAACFRERDIRQDGMIRSDAPAPWHPGVEVSFTADALPNRPRIVYATDVCDDWRHNVRSIALGLEALRAVDRYGITRRGEQYAGFAALPSGGADPERGRRLVEAAGGITEALRKHHPDVGGNDRDFIDVQAYRASVGGAR